MATDFLNHEIKAGCTVVYPCRRTSRMWLKTLKVDQVENDQLTGHDNFGFRIHIKNIKNCIVVKRPKPPKVAKPTEVPTTAQQVQEHETRAKDDFYQEFGG